MGTRCDGYLFLRDCEGYVECILRSKGFKIVAKDQHGYDFEAYYPAGMYYYFIEVKCGPSAKLSRFQRMFKAIVESAREEQIPKVTDKGRELIPKYVVCQFDDNMTLMGDADCKRLLRYD